MPHCLPATKLSSRIETIGAAKRKKMTVLTDSDHNSHEMNSKK